ncbi:TIGR02678 family protein [Actinoplanes sp. NPDC049265]|uniref:TIGR02678 family protein n=1 Tax=Actinoplanes sp. NPDC049265 TaxID=3363902 RepID=UPI0037101E47
MRFAAEVSDLELADYQRAVRLLLRHPLITATWPDEKALPRIRRFAAELRGDLSEAFGYRLELHGGTARLVRTADQLATDRPATSRTGRPFDRQRYAYLSLCLAALGRAGIQITLSELAGAVAADAGRVTGLGLDPDSGADRRAFVDAVGWLEERGVLRLADGSSSAWASDPDAGEALYDVARDAVLALFRPPRVLQHIDSATDLLDRSLSGSGNAERRATAQAARRATLERPVVYYDDVSSEVGHHLRGQALSADLYRLTGLRLERRNEGVLLVDTAGWSAERFPGTGSVAQAALLLAVAIAERVTDPDGRRTRRIPVPDPAEAQEKLIGQVDAGLPAGVPLGLDTHETTADVPAKVEDAERRLPLITDSFLREATAEILHRYGPAFGAAWHADPDRLRTEAIELLTRFGAVLPVPGGVLGRPLLGRYRSTVAQVRQRTLY